MLIYGPGKNWSDLEIQGKLCGNLSSQVASQSEIEFICKFLNLLLSISNVCESKILHAPQETCYRNAHLWVLPYYVPVLRDSAWPWVPSLVESLLFLNTMSAPSCLAVLQVYSIWLLATSEYDWCKFPKFNRQKCQSSKNFSVSSNIRIRLFDLCQILTTSLGFLLGGDHFLLTYGMQMPRERVLNVTVIIKVW